MAAKYILLLLVRKVMLGEGAYEYEEGKQCGKTLLFFFVLFVFSLSFYLESTKWCAMPTVLVWRTRVLPPAHLCSNWALLVKVHSLFYSRRYKQFLKFVEFTALPSLNYLVGGRKEKSCSELNY